MANGAQGLAGGQGAPQIAPGGEAPQGVDMQAIQQALQQAISQVVDESGFVDVRKLIAVWPQIAQQLGINIPFETVLSMIGNNPDIISNIIVEMGLAGITVDGNQITADQLAGAASGAVGPAGQGAGPQVAAAPQGGV
jgi:hypothetical protein